MCRGHFQKLGNLEGRLVVEPVAPAVAKAGQVSFGAEYSHVHVFAFGIACRNFFARNHQRHVGDLVQLAYFFTEGVKAGERSVRLFGVVFGGVGKIVGVVGATYKIEPDGLGRLLQYCRRGSVFHVVCRVVRVAMHFAGHKSRRLGRFFCKNLDLEGLGF